MLCPRDQTELVENLNDSFRCPECGGLLLRASKHSVLKGLRDLASKAKDGELICPQSGRKMKEIVLHGVTVDFCLQSERVWLDQGELEKIQAFRKVAKKIPVKEERSIIGDIGDAVTDNIVTEIAGAVIEGLAGTLGDIDIF